MVTFTDLREANFDSLDEFGALWNKLARGLDEVVSETDSTSRKHLTDEHYVGPSADFVDGKVADLVRDVEDGVEEARKISHEIQDTATEFQKLQKDLDDVTSEADATGYDVDQNGSVRVKEHVSDDMRPWLVDNIDDFQDRIDEVLIAAEELNDKVLSTINSTAGSPDEWRSGPDQVGADLVEDMENFLGGNPGPEEINEWWEGLSEGERTALMMESPRLLGGTDGIPSDVRDEANRSTLEDDLSSTAEEISDLEDELEELQPRWSGTSDLVEDTRGKARREEIEEELERLNRVQDGLNNLQERLGSETASGQDMYLLDYGTENLGQAVISVGNPDEAANTAVYVPGTGSSLDEFGTSIDRAEAMAEDANESVDEETAVIAWMDYDAPQNAVPEWDKPVPEAMLHSYADNATEDLSSFINGIDSTHNDDGARTTLMGHSYGSVVTGKTVAEGDIEVDALVSVASPGTDAHTVDELPMDPEDVWSTTAEGDAIEFPAGESVLFGRDPAGDWFGGNVFESDAIGESGTAIHGGYWDDENETARDNFAHIITGQTDLVDE